MKTIKLILFISIFFHSLSTFSQVSYIWNGASSGSFGDVTNWLPEGLPSTGDSIIFDNGISLTIDNVPNGLMLGGIKILFSGVDGTIVHFNFETGASDLMTHELIIHESCALNYSASVGLSVEMSAVFNQSSLNIPNAFVYLNSTCFTNFYFQNTINAFQVDNLGIINVNDSELILNCKFYNSGSGILNLNSGILIINNELYNDINSLINGSPSSVLIISSSATHIDPFTTEIQLGTFDYNAPFAVQLSGDMTVEDYFHLGDGELILGMYTLNLNGDFYCGGGLIGGTINSILNIGNGANSGDISTLAFNEIDNRSELRSLLLNRDFEVVHLNSNLSIFENLTLSAGKLKINNYNLFLYSSSNVSVADNDTYIITGKAGTVSRSLIEGSGFTFPVGTEFYFAPININPNVADDFIVSVYDSVYTQGYTGQSITDPGIVNLTWKIESITDAGPYDPIFSWNTDAEGPNFYQPDAFLMNFDIPQNEWVQTVVGTSNVSTIGSINLTDLDVQGLFAVSSVINNPPEVSNQTFSIPEHSPNGTELGKLIVRDPDPGQILSINIINEPDPNPFVMYDDFNIFVSNEEFLEYSINPVFDYDLEVCDNGMPVLCSPFHVTVYLEEVGNDSLKIANLISPNNDTFNDTWKISGLDLINIDVFIYNNSGNLVYESVGYRNDWDGTSNGVRLPSGIYYYIIRTVRTEHKGTITLIR